MSPRAPFRADEVGSLLRPPELKAARAAHAEGRGDAASLRAVEDACIRAVVLRQEQAGLQAVTDGELRRSWWHFDFFKRLAGVELREGEKRIQFHGVETKAESIAITGRIDFSADHPLVDHFRFLKSVARVTPKMTIPSPSVLHFRGGRASISREVYPELEAFFADTGEAYRKAVRALYEAGCRYLQFDDTVWAFLCSESERAACRARGDDPERLPALYAATIRQALRDKPADLTVTTHVCRGNFRSSWISEGGYEPIAEFLFNETDYDGYFLEYDTERAGGFEPLRFFPKGDKRLVLGLVTSKLGALESAAALKRRIEEAARIVPLEQLCMSPQCGFASTEEGNLLTADEQWAKLERIVAVATEVWGGL